MRLHARTTLDDEDRHLPCDGAERALLRKRVAITPSRELRDEIINSGMEAGMQEQMQLLEQVARSLTRSPVPATGE